MRIPSLGPDPQPPSSFLGLAERPGIRSRLHVLPKKARTQLHAPREHLDPIPGMDWVMAPPHRDSRAGAGMSPGGGGLGAV